MVGVPADRGRLAGGMSDRNAQRARLDQVLADLTPPSLPTSPDDEVGADPLVAALTTAGIDARYDPDVLSVVLDGAEDLELSVWLPADKVEPRLRLYTSAGWIGGGLGRSVAWDVPTGSVAGLVAVMRWLRDVAAPAVREAGGWLGLGEGQAPAVAAPVHTARHQREVLLGLLATGDFATTYFALAGRYGPAARGKRSATQLRAALTAAGATDIQRVSRSILRVTGASTGSVQLAMNVSDGGGTLELILDCRTAVGPIGMPFHSAAKTLHERAHGQPPSPPYPRVALADREACLTGAVADAVALFRSIEAAVAAHPWGSEQAP